MDFQSDLNAVQETQPPQIQARSSLATDAPEVASRPALAADKAVWQRLVERQAATRRAYAAQPYMHTLFEEQVAQRPDAIALVFEEQALTYAALNHQAACLAVRLQEAGVGPEVLVALYLERSLEMIIALLAVLKAGGAYVPLDPAMPLKRLVFMLQDCGAPVVLTQPWLRDRLPAEYSGQIHVLEQQPGTAGMTPTPAPWEADALLAAYLLYTSGSTGQPKGVINTHQGLYNRLFWMQDRYHLTPGDRVLQKTPYSFDVSVWEVFWPLQTGATLVLARPHGQRDSAYLASLLREQGITVTHFVPSMLDIFLGEPDLSAGETLRYIICSGETLSVELQQRCLAAFDAELHNLYGPTEAAIDVTAWACERESRSKTVPIGHPIYNTQIILLTQQGEPVPAGTPGELFIGGMGLARGYHGRPDLTAERFRPHPWSLEPGARLYQTGDLARELPDGSIEFLGRLDHQVKLRGQRIELGEIEFALEQHPDIRSCLVQVQSVAANDQRLTAYVIPQAERKRSPKELRAFLRTSLPDYMIPSLFVYLETWPLLSNGKLIGGPYPLHLISCPDPLYKTTLTEEAFCGAN
ncbi:MAG TPA: amino acid adenylation domain-containing protein [Ktedonobacteraceae bacterium]|nr:amino acid adenylation domain-containing protein [Ktedonobacteraceae bacterium]